MKVQVRFPNDDQYFDIDIERMPNFKPDKEFDKSMFGWWDGTYVEVLKIEKEGKYINPFKMSVVKKTIVDPFVGEIELVKIGETSRHAVGEHIVDIIYEDSSGNYYIDTRATTGGEAQPMIFLRKALIEEIIRVRNEECYEEFQPNEDILYLQEQLKNRNNG